MVAGILGKLLKEGKGGSRMNKPDVSEPPSSWSARDADCEVLKKTEVVEVWGRPTVSCRVSQARLEP